MADDTINMVTFYSFKGGSGRTVCTANISGLLCQKMKASPEHPILLIDMDLDSAGLTILLKKYDYFEDQPWSAARLLAGEIQLNSRPDREEFFKKGLVDISHELGAETGSVRFLGGEVTVGRSAPEGRDKAAAQIAHLLEHLGERNYKAVVVDSASGRQDIARALHLVCPLMVYCCRLSEQFLYGTEKQIDDLLKPSATILQPPDIIILPTAVPQFAPDSTWEDLHKAAVARLLHLSSKATSNKILLHNGVCEVEAFKWLEDILIRKTTLEEDESRAFQAYDDLATNIIDLWHTS